MSAKDIWEPAIAGHCTYEFSQYTCKRPFSIRYDGATYEVEANYRLNIEDEYLEIAAMTEADRNAGFLQVLGQAFIESMNKKRISWDSITSVG